MKKLINPNLNQNTGQNNAIPKNLGIEPIDANSADSLLIGLPVPAASSTIAS